MPSISNFPSTQVRKIFLDYFSHNLPHINENHALQIIHKHQHKVVPSMSLLPPLNDPSLTFVNAGMNAWKDHFLGKLDISALPSQKIANVQKCVRIKDLDLVGFDGYHHTFFEMLGSWSFNGAYTRSDACHMAWDFLTGPMALEKEKLYVTYFSGSKTHRADDETKEIWKSLGINNSHILGFGSNENFWEMGATGPCGPCAEIHYDHKGRGPSFVNKGFDDIVELWNIVFIEAERNIDGTLTALPSQHVDTGMGVERLCAVKNNTSSNFNTDLFLPLFREMCNQTGAPKYEGTFKVERTKNQRDPYNFDCLDTAYRIVGDHTRMIGVCLSDGFLPDTNHRLKYVLRRSLRIIDANFISSGSNLTRQDLLIKLCEVNANILGEQYSELRSNFDRVKMAIEYENEILRQREVSGKKFWQKLKAQSPELATLIDPIDANQFYEATKLLKTAKVEDSGEINGNIAFKLYDSLGLKIEDIEILAKANNLAFTRKDFEESFALAKSKSKTMSALQSSNTKRFSHLKKLAPTEDHYKYIYQRKSSSHYVFPMIKANIIGFLNTNVSIEDVSALSDEKRGGSMNKIQAGDKCGIILDKTTFYSEAGGQVGDSGKLVGPMEATFIVEDCQKLEGTKLVVHIGYVKKGFFRPNTQVKVQIDTDRRIGCMQNHTATHLLNYVLHSMLPFTHQSSSKVNANDLRFDFSAYNADINPKTIAEIESKVNSLIGRKSNIDRNTINVQGIDNFMSAILNGEKCKIPEEPPSEPWYHMPRENEESNSKSQGLQNTEDEPFAIVPKFISIPGQKYPDEINLITVPGGGVEPCCGTHVRNVADVQGFVVLSCKSAGKGSLKSLKCVSGSKAIEARTSGLDLLEQVGDITNELEEIEQSSRTSKLVAQGIGETIVEDNVLDEVRNPKDILKRVVKIKNSLNTNLNSSIPYTVKCEVEDILTELTRYIKSTDRASFKDQMETELEEVLEDCTHLKYIIHHFLTKTSNKDVRLSYFDKMCKDKPMFLLRQDHDGVLTARAVISDKNNYTEKAAANDWLEAAVEILKKDSSLLHKSSKEIMIKPPRGKNRDLIVNMSPVRLASSDNETRLVIIQKIMDCAQAFGANAWSDLGT